MISNNLKLLYIPAFALIIFAISASSSFGAAAIGPRLGVDFDTDKFVLGGAAEVGPVFKSFLFVPSLDFELGDNSFTAANLDFRLYLFHLPGTGLRFYGSAGPTILFGSGNGDSDTELGLSLIAGVNIPMKNVSRYNIEARFGLGDIPEFKLMLNVLFGI